MEILAEVADRLYQARNLLTMGLLHLQEGDLESARESLTQSMDLAVEMQVPYELGLLHCAWVRYHAANAGQPAVDSEMRLLHVTQAKAALAEAEWCTKQLGALPVSELGIECSQARAAIEELERLLAQTAS
jgi:hypothetical protein